MSRMRRREGTEINFGLRISDLDVRIITQRVRMCVGGQPREILASGRRKPAGLPGWTPRFTEAIKCGRRFALPSSILHDVFLFEEIKPDPGAGEPSDQIPPFIT